MSKYNYIWLLIIISGIVTFLIRYFFVQFINEDKIEKLKGYLSFVPVTVLSALFFSGIFEKGVESIAFDNIKIYASLAALISAYIFKNSFVTIGIGLGLYFYLL